MSHLCHKRPAGLKKEGRQENATTCTCFFSHAPEEHVLATCFWAGTVLGFQARRKRQILRRVLPIGVVSSVVIPSGFGRSAARLGRDRGWDPLRPAGLLGPGRPPASAEEESLPGALLG